MMSKSEVRKVLTVPMAEKPNKEYGGTKVKDETFDYTTRRSYELGHRVHAKNSKNMKY